MREARRTAAVSLGAGLGCQRTLSAPAPWGDLLLNCAAPFLQFLSACFLNY